MRRPPYPDPRDVLALAGLVMTSIGVYLLAPPGVTLIVVGIALVLGERHEPRLRQIPPA